MSNDEDLPDKEVDEFQKSKDLIVVSANLDGTIKVLHKTCRYHSIDILAAISHEIVSRPKMDHSCIVHDCEYHYFCSHDLPYGIADIMPPEWKE